VGSKFDHPVAEEHSCQAGNVKLVVYFRFEKASEVCNFNLEINFRLDFPIIKMYHLLEKCILIVIHIIIHISSFCRIIFLL
jgi:hypothetical protein